MVGNVNSNSCEKELEKIKSIEENNYNSKNTLKFKWLHKRFYNYGFYRYLNCNCKTSEV